MAKMVERDNRVERLLKLNNYSAKVCAKVGLFISASFDTQQNKRQNRLVQYFLCKIPVRGLVYKKQ
jgi:hypothetical protein